MELVYPVQFEWTQDFEDFLSAQDISLAHPQRKSGVYKIGQKIRLEAPCLVERFSTLVPNSFFSTGAYSFSFSSFPSDAVVGRYCSIGDRVEVMSWQHPLDRFTTSPVTYLRRWQEIAQAKFNAAWPVEPWKELGQAPRIGNDVWIGNSALLSRDICIGEGAVVAARSIVTADVPPFAIVAGSPARILRYRFSERQIERLMRLRWWQYNYVDLPPENWKDINSFLDQIEERVSNKAIQPWLPEEFELGFEFRRICANHAARG